MTEIDVTRTTPRAPLVDRTGFRLSWGAILAGVVVATALQITLTVLGLAIGLGTWDTGDGLRGFGIGAALWLVLTALVGLFIGGRTTGRLAGVLTRGDGALHGIVMWGVSTLLAVWMIAGGAGALLGGAFGVLGRTAAAATSGVVGAAGQVAGAAVGNVDPGSIDLEAVQREVEQVLAQTGSPALSPDSLQQAIAAVDPTADSLSNRQLAGEIAAIVRDRAGAVDREAITNVVAARTGMSRGEAEQVATRVESAVATARTQIGAELDTLGNRAVEAAGTASDAVSSAAWLTLLGLGLTVAAAAFGAASTARE